MKQISEFTRKSLEQTIRFKPRQLAVMVLYLRNELVEYWSDLNQCTDVYLKRPKVWRSGSVYCESKSIGIK